SSQTHCPRRRGARFRGPNGPAFFLGSWHRVRSEGMSDCQAYSSSVDGRVPRRPSPAKAGPAPPSKTSTPRTLSKAVVPDGAAVRNGESHGSAAGLDRGDCGPVLGLERGGRRHAETEVAKQPILNAVDPTMHRQLLTTLPGLAHDGGLTHVVDLLDHVQITQ